MKLNELEVRKQYQIKISKSFAALEILSDSEDTNKAWVTETPTKESLGLSKFKQNKPWFDDE